MLAMIGTAQSQRGVSLYRDSAHKDIFGSEVPSESLILSICGDIFFSLFTGFLTGSIKLFNIVRFFWFFKYYLKS